MVVVVGRGLPLGFHLESANTAEAKLAQETLDIVGVSRPRGHPKRRPVKLVADRGCDSSAFRRALRWGGVGTCIQSKRSPARWRAQRGCPVVARKDDYCLKYTVERSFAWLGNCRRLLIRWEQLFSAYCSFFAVAGMLLCVKRLSRSPVAQPYIGGFTCGKPTVSVGYLRTRRSLYETLAIRRMRRR